ncbi:MAG: hypothetical protein A2927_00430 [Candidatus Komeilibacteria bacterium RIFCSPLOWO2_01_FULL_45_10]|uniref:dihydrofolate reductase n=1 Tax=Candidatus Komeilibacteria bacterium RIFCSPLOWO2_01_FULL_45_10 TaxID=1798550 RepID=A0A1G2BKU1_9BACT|nr:MAG: hypothetical protein A2927_00430 [Candidatus Komeilibacteria bacterium RIFCSPLOWO2_01_FULL_45_10]
MNFSIIVAVDQKRGIGINNQLPWKIKADFKYFTDVTISHHPDKKNAVIMGRKTWESIPEHHRPLSNRLNVVLSRQEDLNLPESVLHFASFDEALKELAKRDDLGEVFNIGGGKLFAETINRSDCQKLYITEIMATYPCDTFFPEIPATFKKVEESEVMEENGIKFKFCVYEK